MVNPVATVIFDLFLVGTAGLVVAAMAHEYLTHGSPCVGATRRASAARRAAARAAHPVRKQGTRFNPSHSGGRRLAA